MNISEFSQYVQFFETAEDVLLGFRGYVSLEPSDMVLWTMPIFQLICVAIFSDNVNVNLMHTSIQMYLSFSNMDLFPAQGSSIPKELTGTVNLSYAIIFNIGTIVLLFTSVSPHKSQLLL